LVVNSGTAALDMAALLLDIVPGDEVIVPSFTFSSTANAFVLRGATPVFVDVREDTLNLDERLVGEAITARTRAIVVTHYAGTPCDMDPILALAKAHGLAVVEDAAQAYLSRYKGRAAGAIGDLGCLSFHETKNVSCGEGGALIVREEEVSERAFVIRDKGTNRKQFIEGQVDKYTWTDLGSSFVMSEILGALLAKQLEDAQGWTDQRREAWAQYATNLAEAQEAGWITIQVVPDDCVPNAHIFFFRLLDASKRGDLLAALRSRGVGAAFHYVPLHSSPMGMKVGRHCRPLSVSDTAAAQIVRLPLWPGVPADDVSSVVLECLTQVCR
jgi:dTDP-4-amino-4,6-dideoxygalactose transaminase